MKTASPKRGPPPCLSSAGRQRILCAPPCSILSRPPAVWSWHIRRAVPSVSPPWSKGFALGWLGSLVFDRSAAAWRVIL